jgi:AcrR family transcriptional regulator
LGQGKRLPDGPEPDRFEASALAGLPPELIFRRLPVGRHGLPRSLVVQSQRLRLVDAMLRSLPQRGYAATTIGHLAGEAGVSRAAFYEHFESKEECFLTTYDLAVQWLCERVERAVSAAGEGWPARVSAGASELLRLLAVNPGLARLIAIDVLHAGSRARERQRSWLAQFAEALRAGRLGPDRPKLPVELEEMLLGGAISTIARYVDSDRTEQLPEASAELVEYLLIPYLGLEETKRIAEEAA